MQSIRFYLAIPADRYLAYYQGRVRYVVATSFDGRRIQFPANILRPFLGRDGIYGEFVLRYDDNHKLLGIERADRA